MIKAQSRTACFLWLDLIGENSPSLFKAAIILALTSKNKNKPHTVFKSDGTMDGSLNSPKYCSYFQSWYDNANKCCFFSCKYTQFNRQIHFILILNTFIFYTWLGSRQIFVAAPAPDFFFKRLQLLIFFPSGSGSGSWYFFSSGSGSGSGSLAKYYFPLKLVR